MNSVSFPLVKNDNLSNGNKSNGAKDDELRRLDECKKLQRNATLVLPSSLYTSRQRRDCYLPKDMKKDISSRPTTSSKLKYRGIRYQNNNKTNKSENEMDCSTTFLDLGERADLESYVRRRKKTVQPKSRYNRRPHSAPLPIENDTKEEGKEEELERTSPQEKCVVEMSGIQTLLDTLRSALDADEDVNKEEANRLIEEEIMKKAYGLKGTNPWRKYYLDHVIPELKARGEKLLVLYAKLDSFRLKQNKWLLIRCFSVLKKETIRCGRSTLIVDVKDLDKHHFDAKKKNILHVLSTVSLGMSSRKKILEKRANALGRARSSLIMKLTEKRQERGIITGDMLQGEMSRIFRDEIFSWFSRRDLQHCFTALRTASLMGKGHNQIARNHFVKLILGKVLRGWRHYHFRLPRYSYDKVQLFERLRLLKFGFRRWKSKTKIFCGARRLDRKIATQLATSCFHAWHQLSSRQHRIRLHAISKWTNYSQLITGNPFHHWKGWVKANVKLRHERTQFIIINRRLKRKQKLRQIFWSWRHHARYGRSLGMLSRKELFKILQHQTQRIHLLEQQVEGFTQKKSSEKKTNVENELINTITQLQNDLHNKEIETKSLRTALKEKEIKMEECSQIIDGMSRVYPDSIRFLLSRQSIAKLE